MQILAAMSDVFDPLLRLLGDFGKQLAEITFISILFRLLFSVLCSGVIGYERTQKKHAAGFRTYILVCTGAAVVMILNQFTSQTWNSDASRLGAQVISGIGFLGAGTILVTSRNQIKGLTTAAGLWAVACIGLAFGAGFYTLGLLSTLIIIVCLSILPSAERKMKNRSGFFVMSVELLSRPDLKQLISWLREQGLKVDSVEYNPAYAQTGLSVYTIGVVNDKKTMKNNELIDKINEFDFVNRAEIIV